MSEDRRFTLKRYDTAKQLDVVLYPPGHAADKPAPLNEPQDLTGATGFKLHITCPDGTKLIRDMVKVGNDTEGHLRYAWVTTDWDAASVPDVQGQYTVGGLPAPEAMHRIRARMEYEVLGPGSARLTYPDGPSYDTDRNEEVYHWLEIWADLGQG